MGENEGGWHFNRWPSERVWPVVLATVLVLEVPLVILFLSLAQPRPIALRLEEAARQPPPSPQGP